MDAHSFDGELVFLSHYRSTQARIDERMASMVAEGTEEMLGFDSRPVYWATHGSPVRWPLLVWAAAFLLGGIRPILKNRVS